MRTGKQGRISDPLMRSDHLPKTLRKGYGYEEIMGGQKLLHLFVQPLFGFILLAGRTVPVAAAAGNGLYGATVLTAINKRSESAAAAINDVLDGFFMDLRHPVSIK